MVVSVVEVPLSDGDTERILVDAERGPLVYQHGGRMGVWKQSTPVAANVSFLMGPKLMATRDLGPGCTAVQHRCWRNRTSTLQKVDLLTVAKKNRKFLELKGEGFCQQQELMALVAALPPPQARQDWDDAKFRVSDTLELDIVEGPAAGSRVLCRVTGKGSSPGLYNLRVPPQPPVVEDYTDATDIPETILHRLDVTVWRCTYQLGMDIRENPESEGPIKNNLARVRPTLAANEAFRVVQELQGDGGVLYLRLEDGSGWVFDKKPGVGVACVRDTAASAEDARGIKIEAQEELEDPLQQEALAGSLQEADASAVVQRLQRLQVGLREQLLKGLSEEQRLLLQEHLLSTCSVAPMDGYLLSKH